MIVSELIDLLREEEREGHGSAEVTADGLVIDDLAYDSVTDAILLTVYSPLPGLLPEDVEEEEETYEDDYEPAYNGDGDHDGWDAY